MIPLMLILLHGGEWGASPGWREQAKYRMYVQSWRPPLRASIEARIE
jgi:hypothetical protein